MQQIGGAVVVSHRLEIFHESVRSDIDVVVLESGIVLDGFVPADVIEAETWRRAVVVVIDVSEDEGALVTSVLQGPPEHLHGLLVETCLFVLVVDAGEEEGLESHLAEKRG